VRIDGQATVPIGAGARGGLPRGEKPAWEHDLGWHEPDMPCGLVEEESGQLHLTLGSAYTTRDCSVEALAAWWAAWEARAQGALARLQINRDNGPESSGRRTPCLRRMVAFCEGIGQPRQRLYDPPSHRQYNPIERCGGLLAWPGNGTTWVDVATMGAWATSMPWTGIHPLVTLSRQVDQKGVPLSQRAMQVVAARLERDAELPYWDMLICPASTS
jgi:hypothetical protein